MVSPSSGKKTLSRLESLSERFPTRSSAGSASSRCTSRADLSSRSPWNDGARRRPSCVHSTNSTSQTSSGLTQTTSVFRTFGIFGTTGNGLSFCSSGRSFASSSSIALSVNPVPTLPA